MKLTAIAVSRPVTTLMTFVAIIVLGAVSYTRLPVQLIPDITFPVIAISSYSDASTQDNLDNITRKLEGIVSEMPKVKRIRSYTRPNNVWMEVNFEYGTDIQYAFVDLEERLASFRNSLPDRRARVNAFPFSTADFQTSFMFLSVRGKGDPGALFKTAADKVEQNLKSISGVSNVELRGLTRESVEVDMRPDLLGSYRLDFGTVIGRVQAAASQDNYLGRLRVPGETHYVRSNDRVKTVEELANTFVDGKGVVRLRDVANISLGTAVDRWVSRSNGKNAVNIRMEREAGRNLIELARATRKRVEEINKTLPPDVELVIDQDFAKYVEDAIEQVRNLALGGALLALLVPLIFFRSLRVALIIFTSVPICLISVFNLFLAADMSINIFSIVGLALGVGMLVDNSIVVVENTFRLYNHGASPLEAARRGGVEVGRGLLAATLTTAVVFVPIIFLEGEFKLIVREPTLALVFPLLLSLLVALTIVPVFTYVVLLAKKRKREPTRRLPLPLRIYAKILKSAMRYRARVIFIIAVAVAFTWLESCQRIQETTSSQQAGNEYVGAYFQSPRGSKLSDVNRAAVAIEERLEKHPTLKDFTVSFNADGGYIDLRLLPLKERPDKQSWQEFRATILDFIGAIPGTELSFNRFDQPTSAAAINFGQEGSLELKGLEIKSVQDYAERLIGALRNHPDITNAKVREQREDPLYLALVDRDKTRLFGVNSQAMGRYVGATRSSGTISSLQLIDGEKRTDVAFTIAEVSDGTLDSVKNLLVYAAGKGTVPFGDLVRFQTSMSQAVIRRTDRQSSLDLAYYYKPNTNTSVLKDDIKQMISLLPNPGGVIIEFSGEAQRVDERQKEFFFILIAGAVLVYVVMAAVFESFWVPFTILATNPLMLIGIVWGLDIAKLPLDDLAAFGVILLVGLAVNNGIVMMDRALSLQRMGLSRTRAVFDASITRLRPIMMTYLTTALGLAPLAMYGEEGNQWRPVAVVIIGGLTSATILTLIVLPCFYMIGDDFVAWARKPFLNFLKVCFEVIEGGTNILMHPIRVLRGEIALAPSLWPFLGAAFMLSFELLRIPGKILLRLPGDAWHLARVLWNPRARPPAPRRPVLARTRVRLRRRGRRLLAFSLRLLHATLSIPRRILTVTARIYRRILRIPTPTPIDVATLDAASVSARPDAPPIGMRNIQVIFPPSGLQAVRTHGSRYFLGRRPKDDHSVHALKGIQLDIAHGLFGLLGPNGAGKTTLLRCIAGLLEPTRGTVRLYGVSHREAPAQLAPLIGYLPQNHGHYDWMTLYGYLNYFAMLTANTIGRARAVSEAGRPLLRRIEKLEALQNPRARDHAIMRAIEEVNLRDAAHQRLGSFSGGMKQRAGIARILLQAPPILLVDEPTAGLDPVERMNVRLLLARLAENHLVIFSTHIVEDLEQSCSEVAVLDKGALIFHGAPGDLRAQWAGNIWDVFETDQENPEQLRADLLGIGARVLFQVVRQGKQGFRILHRQPPAGGWLRVEPSLEDALLATLGRQPED